MTTGGADGRGEEGTVDLHLAPEDTEHPQPLIVHEWSQARVRWRVGFHSDDDDHDDRKSLIRL